MTVRDAFTLLLTIVSAVAVYFFFAIGTLSAVPAAMIVPAVGFLGAVLAILAVPAVAPPQRRIAYLALATALIFSIEVYLAIASEQRPLQMAVIAIGWAALIAGRRQIVAVSVLFLILFAASALDWPSLRQAVPADLSRYQAAISDFRSYRLERFFNEETLWRIDAPVDTLDQIAGMYYAKPVDAVPPQFFRIVPWYWPHGFPQRWKATATPAFPAAGRGSDGTHFFMLIDLDRARAFVWYKTVF